MFQVRKHDKIAEIGLAELGPSLQLSTDAPHPEALILRSHKLQTSEFGDKLLAIGRAGAGVNNIPVDEATKRGVVVFNTPGANANAVKEMVVASLLLASRKVVESAVALKAVSDRSDFDKKAEKMKAEYAGPELAGKTLGVIGLGAIGVLVTQAAVGLDMKVIGYDPYVSVQAAWNIPRQVKHATSLEALVAECDYITIHIPMMESTKGLVNAGLLSRMKRGVRIVNLARAEIVNVPDLVEAMDDGKVAYFVSDFADERLIDRPNVLSFPHLGASTPEAEDNCAVAACRQIRDYLETGVIRNSVNFPNVNPAVQPGLHRVCILHKNVPKMLATISETIGAANLNIADMTNASKGEAAYTVLDLDAAPPASLQASLAAIPNVMKVRVIAAR